MTAYYNDNNPIAVHILKHAVDIGLIAPGFVDNRSITDVEPNDLKGFTQCHFFAGGGFWSQALRSAGWSDERPIWTASLPCQPFSSAGKQRGTDDPRHLWPYFRELVSAGRPPVIVGEQVASKIGYDWFGGIRTDLEDECYISRSVDFPACSVNSPHKRNRQYWCAVSMDYALRARSQRYEHSRNNTGAENRQVATRNVIGSSINADRLVHASPWRDAEWILCHDNKKRRTKPGIRFLVDGFQQRVGLWCIAGNAIVPKAAEIVIESLMETIEAGELI